MLQLVPRAEPIDFDSFYKTQYPKTVQYIYKKIGNMQDAEDLAEESFLYCYSHLDTFDSGKSSLSTWLYLIINSRIKNHYRDARTYVDLESLVGVLPDEGADMDTCLYLEDAKSVLAKAIRQLPERQQKIVIMSYFENRTSNEIGSLLGMTAVNVRVQLSRALNTLEKLCSELL